MKLKKIYSIIQKDLNQKIAIKGTGIKIEIQNNFYFLLKGGIEKKNQFTKRIKKNNQKNEDRNCHKE
jgi:hypothetical protein